MRDRPSRLEVEPDGPLAQLIGVLPRSAHRWSISFPQDSAWRRSLQETQGPSDHSGDPNGAPRAPTLGVCPANGRFLGGRSGGRLGLGGSLWVGASHDYPVKMSIFSVR